MRYHGSLPQDQWQSIERWIHPLPPTHSILLVPTPIYPSGTTAAFLPFLPHSIALPLYSGYIPPPLTISLPLSAGMSTQFLTPPRHLVPPFIHPSHLPPHFYFSLHSITIPLWYYPPISLSRRPTYRLRFPTAMHSGHAISPILPFHPPRATVSFHQ